MPFERWSQAPRRLPLLFLAVTLIPVLALGWLTTQPCWTRARWPRRPTPSSPTCAAMVGYRRQFIGAFGHEPQWDDIARPLASYVRTIRSGNSRYDRFHHGAATALTEQEQRGMRVFLGKGNCWSCHAGPNLSDERFHNTGVAFREGQWLDTGRFVVSQKPADRGAFKTPTRREVARTAPYMHDGSLATLDEVVDYYDRGGNANPGLDTILRPIGLAVEDKRALVAFLCALSGNVQDGS